MNNKTEKYQLPSLEEMLIADRKKLNEHYEDISTRQSRCKYGSKNWKNYNDCLNVIRIELEQRAFGK